MKINIFKKTRVPISDKKIEKIIGLVLKNEKISRGILNILFLNNAEILTLNRKFRKVNTPTDVLAFGGDAFKRKKIPRFLGDIAVSVEMAEKRARLYGNSVKKECALYIIHGVLHLVGYDDESLLKRKIMLMRQEMILNRICETKVL